VISASAAPAARASSAIALTPSGCAAIRVGDHGHEQLAPGRNRTVFQDALAHRHLRVNELRVTTHKRFGPRP
jgi:hypothetical protein